MDIFSDIKHITKELTKLYDIKYEIIKPEIIRIISNRIKDPKIIEWCLDQTLNMPTDKGFELHSLLCGYYSMINKKSAEWYLNEYSNFWDAKEEKEVKWKSIKK